MFEGLDLPVRTFLGTELAFDRKDCAARKEHLLVSKALPVFRPHTASAPLATYHFCMRSIVPVLRLKFEAFRLSLYGLRFSRPR
jgi:hypothetical protein